MFETGDGQIVCIFVPASVCHECCTRQCRFLDHALGHTAIIHAYAPLAALLPLIPLLLLRVSAIPFLGVVVEGDGDVDEIPCILGKTDSFSAVQVV